MHTCVRNYLPHSLSPQADSDDVTYSTVVHSNTAPHVHINTEEQTEYATLKTH